MQSANLEMEIGEPEAAGHAAPSLKALARDLPAEQDETLRHAIASTLRRCRKSGFPVKRLLAAFGGRSHTAADFELALKTLRTRTHGPTAETRACAWLLGVAALNPEETQNAGTVLREVLASAPSRLLMPLGRRLQRAALWTAATAAPLALVASIPAWFEGTGVIDVFGFFILFGLFLFSPMLLISTIAEFVAARKLRFITAHALGRVGDVRAIDALAGAGVEDDHDLRKVALISLRILLPRLTQDHYGALGSDAVPRLCRHLKRNAPFWNDFHETDFAFEFELLKALAKIGDRRALEAVRLADRRWPPGPLKEAAARTIEALEERQRRETERSTLLRGTSEPAADPAILLRAANAQTESQPEHLLRPVE